MRRGGEVTTEKLAAVEAELLQAEADLAERQREHERLLGEAVGDVALGAVSPGDASARTRPSESALDLTRERVEQLRRALPEPRARLEQQQGEQEERERQAAAQRVERACQAANASAAKLGKLLAEADRAARDLVAKRADVDSVVKTAGARLGVTPTHSGARPNSALGPGTGRTPDGWLDEPSWDEALDMLPQVMQDGPRRPLADGEAYAQEKAEERARQEDEIRRWLHVPARPARTAAPLPAGRRARRDPARGRRDPGRESGRPSRPGHARRGARHRGGRRRVTTTDEGQIAIREWPQIKLLRRRLARQLAITPSHLDPIAKARFNQYIEVKARLDLLDRRLREYGEEPPDPTGRTGC